MVFKKFQFKIPPLRLIFAKYIWYFQNTIFSLYRAILENDHNNILISNLQKSVDKVADVRNDIDGKKLFM